MKIYEFHKSSNPELRDAMATRPDRPNAGDWSDRMLAVIKQPDEITFRMSDKVT